MADLTEAPVNDLQEFDRLAAQVLEKIPLGQELVRLGPRPLFIEFCGTPKSGKTSCADKLLYYLRKKTYNAVKMVEKPASARCLKIELLSTCGPPVQRLIKY